MRRNTANIKAKSVLGKLGKMYCLNMARQIERGREEIFDIRQGCTIFTLLCHKFIQNKIIFERLWTSVNVVWYFLYNTGGNKTNNNICMFTIVKIETSNALRSDWKSCLWPDSERVRPTDTSLANYNTDTYIHTNFIYSR